MFHIFVWKVIIYIGVLHICINWESFFSQFVFCGMLLNENSRRTYAWTSSNKWDKLRQVQHHTRVSCVFLTKSLLCTIFHIYHKHVTDKPYPVLAVELCTRSSTANRLIVDEFVQDLKVDEKKIWLVRRHYE